MTLAAEDDPWLGTLQQFPTVLHATASLQFDTDTETLQRAILRALRALAKTPRQVQLSLADHDGYFDGEASFKVGIGNETFFDLLDPRQEERVLQRIEQQGPFPVLDLSVSIHYAVKGGKRHNVRGDRYIARLLFQPEGLEFLLHHLKGIKRIAPDQLIELFLASVNTQLRRQKQPELRIRNLTTT